MSLAQLKLAAIRARIDGHYDHPALAVFGPLPVGPNGIYDSIEAILDAEVSDAAMKEARSIMEAIAGN